MKKFIFGIAALVLFSTGCSDDEGSASTGFDSNILVNGIEFTPSANNDVTQNVVTSLTEGVNNGEANVRTFHLNKTTTDLSTMEALQFSLIYPVAQSSIDGTYNLDSEGTIDPNLMAQGMYMLGGTFYSFTGGTITFDDLGGNKFRIEFNSVVATDIFTSGTKTITGHFEGTFAVTQEN
ncbi:MAG TPA: hypothetical protein VF676_03965 [Flavobacterium sp.]|jgi:hypothetical protein